MKKIFGAIILLAMFALPQIVSAEKTDWYDRHFDFRDIKTLIVFDMTVNPGLDYGDEIELRNLQDTFVQNAGKMRCKIITEAQARQMIGWQIGTNLDAIFYSNPVQARHLIMKNAYRIADGWVIGNVDAIANDTYIEPERTVWETREEKHTYRDRRGHRREETRHVQVPVTYPPRRVDRSTIQVSMQVFEARGGAVIFARKDVRDRNDYRAQKGMFGRITRSFFEDVGKKIR